MSGWDFDLFDMSIVISAALVGALASGIIWYRIGHRMGMGRRWK